MKLRYSQIEIFHRILALELLFLNVIQPKLLPLTGITPEEWASYLFLLEHFALPSSVS